ncbi:MAG: hypothetical protein A2Z21_09355 [Candidatus Fraserbacteria bacterium RBG_16_55_9]|uniref:Uncharacterized protein n=1 Tax=Fraserbacteria sp. (strain RBG_16_55_9) TaxID=1817864 RepID=A0A1F5US15_FRAXR|nr:MAG: hypothetical protein A2Z21_09355 [Candidatus Fraserbacteria bacterium RBG_16_55_9]
MKPHLERVDRRLAEDALEMARGNRQLAWTEYVLLHFRRTGDLAPGCDMADLLAWYRKGVVRDDRRTHTTPGDCAGDLDLDEEDEEQS